MYARLSWLLTVLWLVTAVSARSAETESAIPVPHTSEEGSAPKAQPKDESAKPDAANPWGVAESEATTTSVEKPSESAVVKKPFPERVRLDSLVRINATSFKADTPWGALPFAQLAPYHYAKAKTFSVDLMAPLRWTVTKGKHRVLDGTETRMTAPDGRAWVVIVGFPLTDGADLESFLGAKQVVLLSSFKLLKARRVWLGSSQTGAEGVGAIYQGILKMQDAMCHLYLTQRDGKGYMLYGVYFDHPGGKMVSHIFNSFLFGRAIWR